jgi:hypothetical protein
MWVMSGVSPWSGRNTLEEIQALENEVRVLKGCDKERYYQPDMGRNPRKGP